MPLIPFPNVPNYPGVPSIPRKSPGSPSLTFSLGTSMNPAIQTAPSAAAWGIYDSSTGEALYSPGDGATLSFFSLAYVRQMQISDFPIEANESGEGAAFASFNKVWQPANPVVAFALSGSDAEMSAFLSALDAACESTNLYTVTTPDASYLGYSIESYSYQRTAQRGATMLMVEISLKQILEVSPNYTNAAPSMNNAKSPSAVPPVNNGSIQAAAPSQSVIPKLSGPVVGVNH